MHILICSILRDNERYMSQFFNQIYTAIDQLNCQHKFSISLYENDSRDTTASILANHNYSAFKNHSIISETLNTPKFGSVVAEERIKNLAIARNKAVLAKDLYLDADYILFLDCDIMFDKYFIPSLVNFQDSGLLSPDMYSGVSITPHLPTDYNIPASMWINAESDKLPSVSGKYRVYDTWSMRRTPNEEWGTWKADADVNPISKFYGTFNSACLIKAEPFKKGIRYNHINNRLGKFDLEHSVLAEKFHEAGYNEIWINQKLFCFHV